MSHTRFQNLETIMRVNYTFSKYRDQHDIALKVQKPKHNFYTI